MASGGVGSAQHVYGELFKMMAGVDLFHVPYRGGGPALADLLAGQVPVMFDTLSTSIEHIRAGKLLALAVTSATRSEVLPDIPTVGDFVPGYEGTGFQGLGAPRNTPAEIINKLNKAINAGSVQNLSHFRLAERRPALAHAVMAPLICWSFSNSMFRYLLVDHAVPAM